MSKQQIQKMVEDNFITTEDGLIVKSTKVACYIRVSTQEQKLHGISLDAQRDKLREYAAKHGLIIVDWYEDEGVSGRKLIKNRPALQRMIKDAQAGKFERIIFVKLDRFFRSIAEYHECMKKIDPVLWTATEEKYDLTTANGRAFVNMKITIAELEADMAGERIDAVKEYKIKTGQAITGSQRQGYAYTVQVDKEGVKRVVKDPETAHIVEDYINHFLEYQNKRQAYIYVKNKYNTDVSYDSLGKMLSDPKLCGTYGGNDNYIKEPYMDMETFIKIQDILKKNVKRTPTNRIYIFSGLLACPCCGRMLSGKYSGGKKVNKRKDGSLRIYYRDYHSYRCNWRFKDNVCTFSITLNEDKIEAALLDQLERFATTYIDEASVLDDMPDVDNERLVKRIKEVKQEMSNSVKSFNKGRMTEAEHDREYEKLEAELKELESQLTPPEERDVKLYEELLKSGWRVMYNALDKENKRAFWRKYVKAIELNPDGTVKQPIFF